MRTLFLFRDGNEKLSILETRFYPLAVLLNRLLSEKNIDKRIKFINLKFMTEETYKLHTTSKKYYIHNYGGMLWYNDVFDFQAFNIMTEEEQNIFIWKSSYEVLSVVSNSIKNLHLLEASEYAYHKGIEIGLNPDYKMIQSEVILHGVSVKASVWVNFRKDGMYSKFTLEKENIVLFEKQIDSTKLGVEFFLEMYKKIEAKGSTIIIKGHKDVEYFPLKIQIDTQVLEKSHKEQFASPYK